MILHEGDGAIEEIIIARMLLDAGAEPDMTDKEKLGTALIRPGDRPGPGQNEMALATLYVIF